MRFTFYQAGSIPGIPGTFANCHIDIAEDGTLTEIPLPLPPHDTMNTQPVEESLPVAPAEVEISQPPEEVQPAPTAEGEAQA